MSKNRERLSVYSSECFRFVGVLNFLNSAARSSVASSKRDIAPAALHCVNTGESDVCKGIFEGKENVKMGGIGADGRDRSQEKTCMLLKCFSAVLYREIAANF